MVDFILLYYEFYPNSCLTLTYFFLILIHFVIKDILFADRFFTHCVVNSTTSSFWFYPILWLILPHLVIDLKPFCAEFYLISYYFYPSLWLFLFLLLLFFFFYSSLRKITMILQIFCNYFPQCWRSDRWRNWGFICFLLYFSSGSSYGNRKITLSNAIIANILFHRNTILFSFKANFRPKNFQYVLRTLKSNLSFLTFSINNSIDFSLLFHWNFSSKFVLFIFQKRSKKKTAIGINGIVTYLSDWRLIDKRGD